MSIWTSPSKTSDSQVLSSKRCRRSPDMSLSKLAGPMRDRFVPLQDFPDLEHLLREKVYTIARLDPGVSHPMRKVLQEIKDTKVLELEEWEIYTTVEFSDMILGKDAPSDKSVLALPDAFKFDREFLRECFLVYSGLWTQDGWDPRVYYGSATSFINGSAQRIRNYELGSSATFGRYFQTSEKQGFQLSHLGVALIAIPRTRVSYLRGWMVGLEAATTLHLGGLYMSPEVYKANSMSQFCPWDIKDIGYKGLCSHNPMSEAVQGLEMTDQEISEMAAASKRRALENANALIERDSIVLQGKELRELNSSDTDYQNSKRRDEMRKTNVRKKLDRISEDRRRIREGEVEKSDPSVAKTVNMDLRSTSSALRSEARALKRKRDAGEEVTISDSKVLDRMERLENQAVAAKTTYAQDTALLKRYDSQPGQLTDIEVRKAQQIKEDRKAKKEREAALEKANAELIKRWRNEPEKLSDADVQRAEKLQAARQKKYDAKKDKREAKGAVRVLPTKRKRSANVLKSDSDVGDNKENEYDDGNEAEDDQSDDDA